MKSHPPSLTDWPQRIREVLGNVPAVRLIEVRAEPPDQRIQLDGQVDVKVANQDWSLLIETKRSGQPRYIRDAANFLARSVHTDKVRRYGVVVAPFLSAQSQDILRSEGLGWMDMAGNSRLSFGGIHIEIERTQHDPFVSKRTQQSLFAPKSARILHFMLANPGPWKVADLSKKAGVSLGQVSNVRQLLLEKEWAQVDPAGGLRLLNPASILDAWRVAAPPPTVFAKGYTLHHTKEMDTQLRLLFGRAALESARVLLAGHSVARRLAPFARTAGEFFYADEKGLDLITRHFKLTPVDKGENITVYRAHDQALWADQIDRPQGMMSAGLIQTYLDLWAQGDRSEEAADHFRRELIDPQLFGNK